MFTQETKDVLANRASTMSDEEREQTIDLAHELIELMRAGYDEKTAEELDAIHGGAAFRENREYAVRHMATWLEFIGRVTFLADLGQLVERLRAHEAPSVHRGRPWPPL